jgi:hypothetical protein
VPLDSRASKDQVMYEVLIWCNIPVSYDTHAKRMPASYFFEGACAIFSRFLNHSKI